MILLNRDHRHLKGKRRVCPPQKHSPPLLLSSLHATQPSVSRPGWTPDTGRPIISLPPKFQIRQGDGQAISAASDWSPSLEAELLATPLPQRGC